MLYIMVLLLIVFAVGLKDSRKLRKRSFNMQKGLGDAIALRNGTFPKRFVRKVLLKKSGRVINKIKGKK